MKLKPVPATFHLTPKTSPQIILTDRISAESWDELRRIAAAKMAAADLQPSALVNERILACSVNCAVTSENAVASSAQPPMTMRRIPRNARVRFKAVSIAVPNDKIMEAQTVSNGGARMEQTASDTEILAQAMEIRSPKERETFLDKACHGNPRRRREIGQLVSALVDGRNFMDCPVLDSFSVQSSNGYARVQSPAAERDDTSSQVSLDNGMGMPVPPPTLRVVDLIEESLLSTAPRTKYNGKIVPELGGIPLLARLGSGGMGAVYYGMHLGLGQPVAVKVLPLPLATPGTIQRFIREAQLAGKIQSPHLTAVNDVSNHEGLFYIVMEYVSGVSGQGLLESMKRRSGKHGLSEADALRIVLAAARGAKAAHVKGIVHRDIKPSNILIPMRTGTMELDFDASKLSDLGMARSENSDLTESGNTLGTPGYMAPEQIINIKRSGKAADVFSLAATLYAMMAGRSPFLRNSVNATLISTINDKHPPIFKLRPDVSTATSDLIERNLAKAPAERLADGSEMVAALEQCIAELPKAPAKAAVPPKPKKLPAPHIVRRNALILGALTVAALAAFFAGAYILASRPSSERSREEAAAQRKENEARGAKSTQQTVVPPPIAVPDATPPKKSDSPAIQFRPRESGLERDEKYAAALTEFRRLAALYEKNGASKQGIERACKDVLALRPDDPDALQMLTRLALPKTADSRAKTDRALIDVALQVQFDALAENRNSEKYKQWIRDNEGKVPFAWYFFHVGSSAQPRHWTRKDDTVWVERNPDGTASEFKVIGRSEEQGKKGTLVQRTGRMDYVLVPDIGFNAHIYWRDNPNKPWTDLGASYFWNGPLVPIILESPNGLAIEFIKVNPIATHAPAIAISRQSVVLDAGAERKRQFIAAARNEVDPLLQAGKFQDAIAVLDRKIMDPAMADYRKTLELDKKDIESVLELRRRAIEALRLLPRTKITLKRGNSVVSGTVKDGARPGVVVLITSRSIISDSKRLDLGTAETEISPEQLDPADVDQFAPKTPAANSVEDLRRRALLYMAAGNANKAKELLATAEASAAAATGAVSGHSVEYLLARLKDWDAQKALQKADAAFAAKDWAGAKKLYLAFKVEFHETTLKTENLKTINEKLDAIEDALLPARELTIECGDGIKMELVLIKRGSFKMGSPKEEVGKYQGETQHDVTISKYFYMGKYAVTQDQYKAVTGWNPGNIANSSNPVDCVSWDDALSFCKQLDAKARAKIPPGMSVQLPTEAQWEYACRAGTTTRFSTGDKDGDLESAGWCVLNSGAVPHPVGQKAPNAFGLYDMHGNVFQWCHDTYSLKYHELPSTDPLNDDGLSRVYRGGYYQSAPSDCRSAYRFGAAPSKRFYGVGVRVIVAAPRSP